MSRLSDSLDTLLRVIAARRGADPGTSYTARLLAAGPSECAKKLGEEAVETAIAASMADKTRVAEESADLLYHLLVLWAATGINADDVAAVLDERRAQSGLEEKARRGKSP